MGPEIFEFTDVVTGSHSIVSVGPIPAGIILSLVRGEGGSEILSVVAPREVAVEIGNYLAAAAGAVASPLADVDLAAARPEEIMALDERGELTDEELDDRLWLSLLGAGVACEVLDSFPPGVRMYFATRLVEWEVGNGGFVQAIDNASGCFAEAIVGYELVDDQAAADLLRRALSHSGDQGALNVLDAEVEGPPWHGVPWGDVRRIAYVRQHRDEFRF